MIKLTKNLILASASPRRKMLLESAGYKFSVLNANIEETYPNDVEAKKVAEYLAQKKAGFFFNKNIDDIILAADTVVMVKDSILDKPANSEQAFKTLSVLSENVHEVITGIAFLNNNNITTFMDITKVHFKKLKKWEIDYYIKNYQPFDKAGSYGIQEWIGMIGIEKIEGSYFNVMGLPIHLVHEYLSDYRMTSEG